MTQPQQYAQQIRNAFPGLALERIELVQGGQYNDVLVVNGNLLFRFPKVASALATLAREVAVLERIYPRLPLPVPRPRYVNLEGQRVGSAFMGYPLLPGAPLWRRDLLQVTRPAVLERLAQQFAHFLQALHAIPLDILPPDVPVRDDRPTWADLYQRIQARLFEYMRPQARQQVQEHFATFLESEASTTFEPVLRHGDFGGGNVLWDRDQGVLTGVIDFGAVARGDAATDLASLGAGFGDAMLERCSQHYPLTAAMSARIRFYRGTFALQEALFGAENGDPAAFAAGIAAYT